MGTELGVGLAAADRLEVIGDEVVGAGLDSPQAIVPASQRRDHHDRNIVIVRVASDPATHFESVQSRQPEVQQEHVKLRGGQLREGFVARTDRRHFKPVLRQGMADRGRKSAIVLGQQDTAMCIHVVASAAFLVKGRQRLRRVAFGRLNSDLRPPCGPFAKLAAG